MKYNVSKDFCIKCQKYIDKHLDMRGGGSLTYTHTGRHIVFSCHRASKFKIFRVNVVLFFMWLFRPRKFKKLDKMALASITIIGIFLIFYVGLLLGIMYELLLATGG